MLNEVKSRKAGNIKTFIKTNCCNYDGTHQWCLLNDEDCLVLNGKRCGHFERAVLCLDYTNLRLPGIDYEKLIAQYAELINDKKKPAGPDFYG